MTELKHIIRIANTDLLGEKNVVWALQKIKGVGYSLANAVCHVAGIDINKKAGALTDKEAQQLNDILNAPQANNIPVWMANRRKDYETGADLHLLGGDLRFTQENDVKRLRKIKTYRGIRHGVGLPVRGQRTQSNFRRNKGKAVSGKKPKGSSGRV